MEHNQRIENKIDKILGDVTDIKITLGQQHIILVQHESRSTKLETIVAVVQKKISMFEGALKLIGGISIVAGIIETLKILIK